MDKFRDILFWKFDFTSCFKFLIADFFVLFCITRYKIIYFQKAFFFKENTYGTIYNIKTNDAI